MVYYLIRTIRYLVRRESSSVVREMNRYWLMSGIQSSRGGLYRESGLVLVILMNS